VRDAFVSSHQRLEGLKPPSADLLHRFVVWVDTEPERGSLGLGQPQTLDGYTALVTF
jgi:hypothetical protein